MSEQKPYPDVDARPNFPEIERSILRSWDEAGTFQQSIDDRPMGEDEFVFYDGPPFANGLPHYGHLLTGYVKDVIPRYQTMRGNRVDRRFGWDCHGLPAEMGSEKELGVSGRRNITEFGIQKFNDHCRTSVMRYTDEWKRYVDRQARWVDFENDYKTMDTPYMESVIWAFKELWDKGLIYEAYRVMPYSWGAETVLSNFEIRLDDATRPRQDPAVTVGFTLTPADGDPGPLTIHAWTTTPWTLPSNLALAVGPDIDYAIVAVDGGWTVVADAMRASYERELGDAEVHAVVKGADLVGRTYEPLFPYFADQKNAFRILGADFVELGEGTGIVHMAPGFGEDDQIVCEANDISLVVPVDDEGRFMAPVTDWEGVNVFEANPGVIAYLKEQGRILRHETYDHNYPHCWRTGTPVIYRATSSWYVKVSEFRDRMVELNQEINWVPDHIRDGRFGNWLAGARDWSISRNRFWGSPIPVWQSDNPEYPRTDVYGSLDELEADFGVRPTDLHRPVIDELVRPNPDDPTGKSMMRRVPEVFDCWFESGSMPYAQVHYPFENKEWFESHFPADFIVEYINQTRGWFYTLHVLSTALFDRPPFRNAIAHGIVLAENGDKLSKSKKNYPDPEGVFDDYGSDSLRWYLMASPIVSGGDLRINETDMAGIVRFVLNPIWNAYSFFTIYANADGHRATYRTDSPETLDRYILAKTREMLESVTADMDRYDLPGAHSHVLSFIDALNNWYIRRSRDRFWAPAGGADAETKANAHDTLYTVLVTMMRTLAPFLPMITEEIHRGLTGETSVHLTDWPDAEMLPADPELVAAMDRIRTVSSTALNLREEARLAVRVPLGSLTVAGANAAALAPYTDLVRDEVNVKEVILSDDLNQFASFILRPDGKVLGPRLGGSVKDVFSAAKSGDWSQNDDGSVTVGEHRLDVGEFTLGLEPVGDHVSGGLPTNDAVVVLDTHVTPELQAEGWARHFVRLVQNARKEADLVVTDRIALFVQAEGDVADALHTHEDWISSQVLATSTEWVTNDGGLTTTEDIDGTPVHFSIAVAER